MQQNKTKHGHLAVCVPMWNTQGYLNPCNVLSQMGVGEGSQSFPINTLKLQESWRGSEHSLYHNLTTQSQTGQPNLTILTKDEVKFLLGYPWMVMVFWDPNLRIFNPGF